VIGLGTKRVNIRLPEKLVQEADGIAKVRHKNRTELMKEALTDYLRKLEDEKGFKEEVVDFYLDDEISYDVLKALIGKRDAEAVRASKDILEKGDRLAGKMADLE
jgi:metal-responsive CopG/Arc/MetJ family transcriptional regulator